ncbi:cupin domain-containing protein [Pricia sp. S334]|uniref:Cupin domain-containing protein n=1 Tax=Pricia mediterranea TaxID=3076079 RepID=A0ABU3L3R4_9FLAO|nr:cupin domain-containing protein [Pricia sp. S334]MDT7828213.1 cupin domain-containing protein [Pricia sp. S334]
MKINKNDVPVTMEAPGTVMRALPDYGGMTVCFNELPKGTDFTPLLKGLTNDSCHCPHWGYVLEGAMLIKYDDGTEELLEIGDVFYLPAGHTAIVQKDIKFIDFNPSKEFDEVISHVGKKMAEQDDN